MRILLFLSVVFGSVAVAGEAEFAAVGDLGNAGTPVPFSVTKKSFPRGGVDYPYRIAVREVTNRDYAEFLNATAKNDPDGLYNPKMSITRTGEAGAYAYAAAPDVAEKAVAYVSRVNAAKYCNWRSGGEVYHFFQGVRPNGSSAPGIVGWRDLTGADSPRLFFLPDMHELYKAAFYDGQGNYVIPAPENLGKPSHYGIVDYASGVSEWIENKFYAGVPVLMGANDKDVSPDAVAMKTFRKESETSASAVGGFRIASTADLAIAPRLNATSNFFFADGPGEASLKIRYDGAPRTVRVRTTIRDARYAMREPQEFTVDMKPGATTLNVRLPVDDGYYDLLVTPEDPLYDGKSIRIPFMIARAKMPAPGDDGHFGFTVHLQRWANNYTNELPDFRILRELGVSVIRNDLAGPKEGSRELFRRVRAEGFRPLAIFGNPAQAEIKEIDSKATQRWIDAGVAPEFAAAAEYAYRIVAEYKDCIHDWELGNEPQYWRLPAEDYAQYARALAAGIRRADPGANVILADIGALHDPVLRTGVGGAVDAVAAHIYGFYVPSFWGVAGKLRQFNDSLRAAGVPDKPIWITEIGVSTYSDTHVLPQRSGEEVARYLGLHTPKAMAGALAFGAAKSLIYTFRDVPLDFLEEDFGVTDRYGFPKPGAAAFRTTARLLGSAAFVGFLKGHSFEPGKIAGLAFRDADGKDVLALWRNDPYGESHFEIPFADLIHPAESAAVKAEGPAELIELGGASRPLENSNGAVTIPVDEFPVFARGRFAPEFENVPTSNGMSTYPPVAGFVQIQNAPTDAARACDRMEGEILAAASGERKTIRVCLYNPGRTELRGTMRVHVTASWRENRWTVSPAATAMIVSAGGKGNLDVRIDVPDGFYAPERRYVIAEFSGETGERFTDKVLLEASTPKPVAAQPAPALDPAQ